MQARPRQAALVGAFVIGSALLLLAALIALGAGRLLKTRTYLMSHFDESVHGLDVGSPVKFRGVKIGQVSSVAITPGAQPRDFVVAVVYEILDDAAAREVRTALDFRDRAFVEKLVGEGLRARLQVQSFLTGMLYLELDFIVPEAVATAPGFRGPAGSPHAEIPSRPSAFAEIGATIADFTTRLSTVDFAGLSLDLSKLLRNLNTAVTALDFAAVGTEIRGAARGVQALAAAPEITAAVRRFDAAMGSIDQLAASLRTTTEPLGPELAATLAQLRTSLTELGATAEALRASVGPGGGLPNRLDDTLRRLADAADSVRELADFLERHPNALLSGRAREKKDP